MASTDSSGHTNGVASSKTSSSEKKTIYELLPTDPTRIFSSFVLIFTWLRFSMAMDFDMGLLWDGFFVNPYVWLFVMTATAVAVYAVRTRPSTASPLTIPERWAAEWYWWNAWLFHWTMDGAAGSFRAVPVVVQQYDVLDGRFAKHHPIVWGVGAFEFFFMAPLCLITLYCIVQRSPYRYPFELITSAVQFMGMVLFLLVEVALDEQVHVPALEPVGVPGNAWANVKFFDFYQFTYYWFGFWFCNLIWAVVPGYRMLSATREIVQALQLQQSANKDKAQ